MDLIFLIKDGKEVPFTTFCDLDRTALLKLSKKEGCEILARGGDGGDFIQGIVVEDRFMWTPGDLYEDYDCDKGDCDKWLGLTLPKT